MITSDEIVEIAKEQGAERAYGLLLLFGPDCFDGTYTEYENLLIELEVR